MDREKSQTIHRARRSKAKLQRDSVAIKRLLAKVRSLTTGDRIQGRGETGWFQVRERAVQRLRNLSAGKIILREGGYHGDHRRHLMQHRGCGHVFRASLREIAIGGADQACPFCHPPEDLARFDSIQAVQEHVLELSYGNILFSPENTLRNADDHYEFICDLANVRCKQTFNGFMKNIENGCPTCFFRTISK